MARLKEKEYTYFTTVRGMCGTCGKITPARVFFRDGGVWQQSLCPGCSGSPVAIAGSQHWYGEQVLRRFADQSPLAGAHAPKAGCPHDCGPCTWHASPCARASAPLDALGGAAGLRGALDALGQRHNEVGRLVVTGAEAVTAEVLETLNSFTINEIAVDCTPAQFGDDKSLAGRLGDAGVGVESTIDDAARAAEVLEQLLQENVAVVLNVKLNQENIEMLPGFFGLLPRYENLSAMEFEAYDMPMDSAIRTIVEASGGALSSADFAPADGAHPLCRQSAVAGKQKVTVHSLMRPETFDCARAMLCPVCVLTADGLVPRCVHDLRRKGGR